jgi:hypothetical protein
MAENRVPGRKPAVTEQRPAAAAARTPAVTADARPVAAARSLQQRLGNRGAQALAARVVARSGTPGGTPPSGPAAGQLSLSQPGDAHEREADRVAGIVMRTPAPSSSPSNHSSVTPVAPGALVQRRCTECEEEGKGGKVQRKQDSDEARQVTPEASAGIDALRGGGSPLPASARDFFEPRFGVDFSHVRLHTDSRAADTAKALGASAFTVGPDIAFGAGEYAPASPAGKRLLAHELTHVEQQDAVVGQVQRAPAGAPAAPTDDNEADLAQELASAHERVIGAATPEERAWALRVELLLGWSRPASVADDAVFDAFLSRCYQAADSEARTLAALAPKYTLMSSITASAEAFPGSWADRIYHDFHSREDLDKLRKSYEEQKQGALDVAKAIAPAVWDRGLPLTLAQARSLSADDMVWLVLNFKRLATSAHESTDRYAAAMAEWLRVAARYGAVAEYEGDLGVQVRDIREGKQSVTLPLYAAGQKQSEQLTLALRSIERPGVTPATVVGRFMHALVWSVPEDLLISGGAWPLKGVDAYRAEIAKVDAWIASAGTSASIGKAFDWAHERGYFGAAGEEVWASFKENGWKMAAAVAAILVAQAIPGVDVALDIILLIEFGLDAISTVVELGEAFTAAGSAKSVLDMEHASALIASTVVGTGAKIVQWLVLWSAGKIANRIAKWRSGKKFLEEHGNSPDARDALKKAKGDVDKASADMKARQEREAARQRQQAQRNKGPTPGKLTGDLSQLSAEEVAFVREQLAQGRNVEIIPRGPGRTPDFKIDGAVRELKTLSGVASPSADNISKAIANRVMNGRGQATDIVVDARAQAGITEAIAERGIRRAYGADNLTGGKITSIRVIGPNFDITIPRK